MIVNRKSFTYWLSKIWAFEPQTPTKYKLAVVMGILVLPFAVGGEILLYLTYLIFNVIRTIKCKEKYTRNEFNDWYVNTDILFTVYVLLYFFLALFGLVILLILIFPYTMITGITIIAIWIYLYARIKREEQCIQNNDCEPLKYSDN